jgi:tetratricopeptide (TPR) repeat protein
MTTQTVEKLINSARELLEANEYLGARALYTQALAMDPFDATLWNYRSNAHMKLGYPELAFTDAARGLQLLDDKLAKTTLSQEDRNFSIFMKIDVLYSCLIAAESLHTFQTTLHVIARLLTNSHLLSDEARQIILEKQAFLKAKINEKLSSYTGRNNPLGMNVDHIANLGTMRVVKYPWDDFEPFGSENDTETQLKEINSIFRSFAPKLSIVRM